MKMNPFFTTTTLIVLLVILITNCRTDSPAVVPNTLCQIDKVVSTTSDIILAFHYNSGNNVSSIDFLGQDSTYFGTYTMIYNVAQKLEKAVFDKDNYYLISYDGAGNPTGLDIYSTPNKHGRVDIKTDASGNISRCTTITSLDGFSAPDSFEFEYDGQRNVTKRRYYINNELWTETIFKSFGTSKSYHQALHGLPFLFYSLEPLYNYNPIETSTIYYMPTSHTLDDKPIYTVNSSGYATNVLTDRSANKVQVSYMNCK